MSDIIRRDPRVERICRNRLHPLHESLSRGSEPQRGPSGVLRKNPHSIGFTGPNGIKRIDRLTGNSQASIRQRAKKVDAEVQLPLVTIDNPDFYIVAVLDLVGGRLSSHDKDVLGQAQSLVNTSPGKGAVIAVVFASDPAEIKEPAFDLAGADRLIKITGPSFQGYAPEAKVTALKSIGFEFEPRNWLFPDSVSGGNELGCRLAASMGVSLATQVWKVAGEIITCRSNSGLTDTHRLMCDVLLLAQECAAHVDEQRHEARVIEPSSLPETITRIEDKGLIAVDPAQIALNEAEFILSAGNGIHNWDQFHEAAHVLGATEGASRVAVDDGFMPRERQVGATGTWVNARVYIAVGISGAIQHLQGIGNCEKVIAINTDAGCDMVKRADLSVIGDSEEILRALVNLVQEHRQGANHVA